MRMTLTSAALVAADTDARVLRGVAIPYGVYGSTSAGRVCVDAGAITVPENLRAVKLFTEHGRTTPTGYAVDAADSPEALEMAFTVARTASGDQALLEASEGVRDALSVELDNVKIEAGHVTAADLVAVAQVALPAFAGAQLVAALTDDQQAEVNDLAQQIVDATAPEEDNPQDTPADGPPDAAATTEEENPMTATASEAPAQLTMTPPADARRPADANTSLEVYAAQAAAAIRAGSGSTAELNAALQDIVPANTGDPGGAFLRPGWLGEMWSASQGERPLATMLGVGQLTSPTFEGWQWTLKPKVAHYAGNKTEVPSSPATAGLIQSGPVQRIAGAWDVDRIYIDFDSGMLTSFLQGAVDSYNQLLEEDLAALVESTATDLGASADALSAIGMVISSLYSVGARADYIALASDVFSSFINLTESEVPWWLQSQASVALGNGGSASVADLSIGVAADLPAGTVLGGDRRALDVRATGPIRVEAVNVPNGGIDVGLFGYENHIVNDARAIVKTTVGPVIPLEGDSAGSRTAKKSASSK